MKVILEQGIHAFTIQNVAEAAGISHRTVYRHFDSREALFEGLQDAIQKQADDAGLPVPSDLEGDIAIAGALFQEFYRMKEAMHASVIAATALGYQTVQQRGSIDYLYALLRKRFAHVPTQELLDAAAIVRSLINRYTWYVLAINHEMPAEDGGRAIDWGMRAIMAELERSDRAHDKPTKAAPKARSQAKKCHMGHGGGSRRGEPPSSSAQPRPFPLDRGAGRAPVGSRSAPCECRAGRRPCCALSRAGGRARAPRPRAGTPRASS